MILVDDRMGAKQLYNYFTPGRACIRRLDSADFAFDGLDRDGSPCVVGVERKTVHEVLSDWERFVVNQLPNLLEQWTYTYLLVEGSVRPAMNAPTIETWYHGQWKPEGKLRWGTFVNKLHTLRRLFGITVIQSGTEYETVKTVESLEDWWRKDWSEHNSCKQVYVEPPPYVLPSKPTPYQTMVASIPDIGWKTALDIISWYPTMEKLMRATTADLEKVKGVGKARAKQIFNVLRRP